MNIDNRIYAVVIFPPEKGSTEETVNVVPQSWLQKDCCLWPKVRNPNRLIEDCLHPSKSTCDWQKCDVKEICRENIEGYKKARTVEYNVMEGKEGNLSELSDLPQKRPTHRTVVFSPSASPASKQARLENANDADNESDDSPVTRSRRACSSVIMSPSLSNDGSPNQSLQLPTPPTKQPSPVKRPKPVRKNLFCKTSKISNGSTVKNTSRSTVNELVRTNREDNDEHTHSNREDNDDRTHSNKEDNDDRTLNNSTASLNNSTASLNNNTASLNNSTASLNNSTASHKNNTEPLVHPSSSNEALALDFRSILSPASNNKSSGKFLAQWEKMSPSQKEAFIAESLFVLRKTLPLLVQKGAGSNPDSAAVNSDAFKKDAMLNCFPINDQAKLNEAEAKLKKKGFKEKLTNLLLSKKCEDLKETGRRMCALIFTDEFGKNYSLHGRKQKKKFLDLPLVTLIKTALGIAYSSKKPPLTEEEQHSAIDAWVKYCGARISQKEKAVRRGGNQPGVLPSSEDEEEEELQDHQS
nr:PREDICTED: uncharacterized protein DDB_G0289357-like isoform X2 [Bemisia tabaci]